METQIKHFQDKLLFEMDPSDLFDAINNGEKIVAVDARMAVRFNEEHIPTAINLPHREMNAESTADLDKGILYVVYCDGVGCNASTKGALNLSKLGFKVKELIGGIRYWKVDGFSTGGIKGVTTDHLVTCAC